MYISKRKLTRILEKVEITLEVITEIRDSEGYFKSAKSFRSKLKFGVRSVSKKDFLGYCRFSIGPESIEVKKESTHPAESNNAENVNKLANITSDQKLDCRSNSL